MPEITIPIANSEIVSAPNIFVRKSAEFHLRQNLSVIGKVTKISTDNHHLEVRIILNSGYIFSVEHNPDTTVFNIRHDHSQFLQSIRPHQCGSLTSTIFLDSNGHQTHGMSTEISMNTSCPDLDPRPIR